MPCFIVQYNFAAVVNEFPKTPSFPFEEIVRLELCLFHNALSLIFFLTPVSRRTRRRQIFFFFRTDVHLNYKDHIDEMIAELCRACDVVWSAFHINNTSTLGRIYFTCFHSIIRVCGIILGLIRFKLKKKLHTKRKLLVL